MNLERKFQELKNKGEGAHMSHVYFGDPHEEFSLKLIQTLAENGADIIEFGIPFSDPTADGPTFQAVCERALENGVTPSKCIQGIKKLWDMGVENPIVVTTYYNIPYVMGVGNFMNIIREAGAQAVIIPNLPVEEADVLLAEGKRNNIHINVEGVTGVRESLDESTLKLVQRVRRHTDMPLMAGFGISNKQQASNVVAAGADGAIAGSCYAKIYEKNLEKPEKTLPQIAQLVGQIKQGCIKGYRRR
jgi:tryptophan synthase alpha chain